MSRLRVSLTPERNCWVALPPTLCNQLLDAGGVLPVVLQLVVLDAATGLSARGVPRPCHHAHTPAAQHYTAPSPQAHTASHDTSVSGMQQVACMGSSHAHLHGHLQSDNNLIHPSIINTHCMQPSMQPYIFTVIVPRSALEAATAVCGLVRRHVPRRRHP